MVMTGASEGSGGVTWPTGREGVRLRPEVLVRAFSLVTMAWICRPCAGEAGVRRDQRGGANGGGSGYGDDGAHNTK